MRTRIDGDDLVADEDVVVAVPLRIDRKYLLRQRVEAHAVWNAGSNPYRDVKLYRCNLML